MRELEEIRVQLCIEQNGCYRRKIKDNNRYICDVCNAAAIDLNCEYKGEVITVYLRNTHKCMEKGQGVEKYICNYKNNQGD